MAKVTSLDELKKRVGFSFFGSVAFIYDGPFRVLLGQFTSGSTFADDPSGRWF